MASLARTLAAERGKLLVVQPGDPVLLERADGVGPNAEIGDGRHGALGHGVHHARLGQDVDQPGPARGRIGQRGIAHRRDHRAFDHAIGQQLGGDPPDLRRGRSRPG